MAEMMRRSACPRRVAPWLYFLVLWLGVELRMSAEAAPEERAGCSRNLCCVLTPQASDRDVPCCDDQASGGRCGAGKCCANKECSECRPLPTCVEGEQLQCLGSIDFRFVCQPCPAGTYSDSKNGCCVPWADCKRLGLQTIQPGNRTHNVQCGTIVAQPDSLITSILAIVTAAGIFILILMTFLLIVCMWTQKGTRFYAMEDPESIGDSNLLEPRELREDGYSCQFPEEEHGGKTVGEKTSLKALRP